jgi:hypothetical protein
MAATTSAPRASEQMKPNFDTILARGALPLGEKRLTQSQTPYC